MNSIPHRSKWFGLLTGFLTFASVFAQARETNLLADLEVTLTSSTTTATNGQWVTFFVTARNLGPTPIYAVDDCEIQCVAADGQYGDNGAGEGDPADAIVTGPGVIDKSNWIIRWFPGAIAPGQAVVMTVQIPLHIRNQESIHLSTANGGYSNGDVCDTNPGNNNTSLQLGYAPATDLVLSIDNQGNTSWDLTSGYYQLVLSVSNAGPSVANGIVVTNDLPPGCTYSIDWPTNSYSFQGNVLTWHVGDHNTGETNLYPGGEALLYLNITPTNAGEKVTLAQLYNAYDTHPANNTADNSMSVTGTSGGGTETSVQLMGWDVEPTVERYGTIQYTLRLKNNGSSNVANVVITNRLDARCLYDSASSPQGSVTQTNGVVVFDVGTLTSGADLYMDLFVIPLESGTLTNDARVYMDTSTNEYGDSAVIEETIVNEGPYLLTVTPMQSVTPVHGVRAFTAIVQTNGLTIPGVTVHSEITRGPHLGAVSNAVTAVPGPGAPAMAVFFLQDWTGYPGLDSITVTGQVGRLPFQVDLTADWQLMGPLTYTCTNLGFIVDNGISQFEIEVPDGFVIADIETGLHVMHTFPGDLEFRLYSPADQGETAVETFLIETLDALAFDDLEIGRSNAFCVLDDSASTSISNAVAPFSGSYQSQWLEMTNYIGVASRGTWILQIEDMNLVDFDYGELLGWTLTLEPDDGDLDNDGMNDDWETDHGLDPTNPNDGDEDDDKDGVSNRNEFRTRTHPQNKSDAFAFSGPGMLNDEFIIRWSSVSNQFYTIRWTTALMNGFDVLESGIPADPPVNEYTVTNLIPRDAFFDVQQEY